MYPERKEKYKEGVSIGKEEQVELVGQLADVLSMLLLE